MSTASSVCICLWVWPSVALSASPLVLSSYCPGSKLYTMKWRTSALKWRTSIRQAKKKRARCQVKNSINPEAYWSLTSSWISVLHACFRCGGNKMRTGEGTLHLLKKITSVIIFSNIMLKLKICSLPFAYLASGSTCSCSHLTRTKSSQCGATAERLSLGLSVSGSISFWGN